MEDRADERATRRPEGFNARMGDFGRLVILQHVVEVVEILYDFPLMIIILQLPRTYSLIVLIQRAPIIWICMFNGSESPDALQLWPSRLFLRLQGCSLLERPQIPTSWSRRRREASKAVDTKGFIASELSGLAKSFESTSQSGESDGWPHDWNGGLRGFCAIHDILARDMPKCYCH